MTEPPEPDAPAPPRPPVPQPVRVSWYLWIAACVVMVSGFGYSLADEPRVVSLMLEQPRDPRVTAAQVSAGVHASLWQFLVGAVVFALLFLLFAWKAQDGTRSARSVLTVLAGATIVFQAVIYPNWVKVAACALIVAATACLYLPGARPYFPKLPKR
ncbi:hypothetical protein [Amycolatopsis magusensis]|uniref:hypothetical protein n=1 Tax=Amycolatopsis magusensis TaxID=882444 RepID=UPI0037B31976